MTTPIDHPDFVGPTTGLAVYTPIVDGVLIANGADTGSIDLRAFTSVVVWSITSLNVGYVIDVEDPDTGVFLYSLTTPPDVIGNTLLPTQIPVQGRALKFHNNTGVAVVLHVIGTSRLTPHDFLQAANPDVQDLSIPSQLIAGTVTLGYGFGGGFTFSEFRIGGNVIKGLFQILSAKTSMFITDTTQFHVDPGGAQTNYVNWVAPRGTWILQFVTTTGGTNTITTRHVYAG